MHHKVDRRHQPLLHPYRSRVSARPTGSATTSLPTAAAVPGQCRYRPEGYRYPRPPPSLPDQCLDEPDFLASILDSIDAMAPAGTSSSAPPPIDGLHPPHSLFPLY